MNLRALFIALINTGDVPSNSITNNFKLRLVNLLALASIVFTIISLTLFIEFSYAGWLMHAAFIIVSIATLIINKYHKYKLAQITLFFGIPFIQFVNIMLIDHSISGSELTMIPFVYLAAFCIEHIWYKILTVGLILGIFIISCHYRYPNLSINIVYNSFIVLSGLMVGIYFTISHFKTAEEEITKTNNALVEKNSSLSKLVQQNNQKTQLLSLISHDLKAPAEAYNQLAEKVAFLLRKGEYNTLLELADHFENSSHRLFRNIDYLLSWSISQNKNITIHLQSFSPNALIDDILETFNYQINQKEITFDIRIKQDATILSDPHLLSMILKSIIENAIKYSPHSSQVIIELISTETIDCIKITDAGPGVGQSKILKIKDGNFEKSKDGYGIGLSISFRLIEILKGQIIFENLSPNGTSVNISILKVPVESKTEVAII